jgi:hypothetical protein
VHQVGKMSGTYPGGVVADEPDPQPGDLSEISPGESVGAGPNHCCVASPLGRHAIVSWNLLG